MAIKELYGTGPVEFSCKGQPEKRYSFHMTMKLRGMRGKQIEWRVYFFLDGRQIRTGRILHASANSGPFEQANGWANKFAAQRLGVKPQDLTLHGRFTWN